ncbi:universal stress protein [Pseudonocardia sp. CA-107938]|uniref:universal stress protein n=1 Tax=Pseudonocardia sp. CA-107938 TaxID=3240021 RepID=UPI003D8E569D
MAGDPAHPTILVVVDHSRGVLDTVRWAAREAAICGGVVRLVPAHRALLGRLLARLLGRSRTAAVLAAAVRAAAAVAPRIPVELSGTDAGTHGRSLLVAESAAADLLVVSGRWWGRVWSLSAGPARWAARCPVVVLPPACGGLDPTRPVVVGVDGTAASTAAVDLAFAFAAGRGVAVVAVHTWWDRITDGEVEDQTGWARVAAEEQMVLDEHLARTAATYPAVVVQRISCAGFAAGALVELSRRAQLVVIGSHRHGRLGAYLVDSAGRALVRAAGCPVVIAPVAAPRPATTVGTGGRGG